MRKLLEKARSYIREYGDMLLIGFLIGVTPAASKAVNLLFEWLADTFLGSPR